MAQVQPNGFLTREKFEALTTGSVELDGLGAIRFRKIGSAEYEALWPVPPAIADTWPKVEATGDAPEERRRTLEARRQARRQAEADWLRTLPVDEQIRWRSAANDVCFRVIAACARTPKFSIDDARALGDQAELVFAAILTFSGLYKEAPKEPAVPPPAAEPAAAGAA